MNSGSIHNPSTMEGRLFRFLLNHLGQEFTTMQLSNVLNCCCLHTYKNGCDKQIGALGYKIERRQEGKIHYYKMIKLPTSRAIPSAGQMMMEAVA